jgi:hypothetical protein
MKLKSNQRGIIQISFIKRHFLTFFLQISQNQFSIQILSKMLCQCHQPRQPPYQSCQPNQPH